MAQAGNAVKKDVFAPTFNVPDIPNGVHLDFSLDCRGTPTSVEGMLKAAVMKDDTRATQNVAALGSSAKHLQLAAVGMGGMGKTCALKGIGHEVDVQQRYHGGVYFISLGQDVKDEGIVSQVADVVKASGGKLLSSNIRLCQTAAEATRKAGPWFARRRCLFICDDLWSSATRKSGFIADLNEFARLCDASCFLFSTRDKDIASHASSDPVAFKAREPRGQEATEMFRKHAKMKETVLQGMGETGDVALAYLLDMCAGLPLALTIAGRSIARSLTMAS
jgi:hypothetical protein